MCSAYKPTDLFNPASQKRHISDNPKEQFPSFTLFPIKKGLQDGIFYWSTSLNETQIIANFLFYIPSWKVALRLAAIYSSQGKYAEIIGDG